MKKICFISISSYPLFNPDCNATFGGSEIQVFNYAKKLAEEFDVSVLVGDFGQKKIEKYANVNVYRSYSLEKKVFNYLVAPFKLYFLLKKINPDIIICRANGPEIGIAAIYKILNKKKLIYMIAHDGDVKGDYFKHLFGKFFKFGLFKSDFVIAQNDFQLNTYIEKFKKGNIAILKNSFILKNQGMKKKDTILWVSRSDTWKKPEIFIKLAECFPNEKFVMIMPKSSELTVWEKYSNKAKQIKNIRFIEYVPFNQIQKYFDKAKVFVNTSDNEGFPNTFIQACLGKTPILSLNVNPDEFITKNDVGYYANENFDLMVDQLRKLVNDRTDWQEKSKNAFSYVKKKHDINKNIKFFEQILRGL